MAASGIDRVPRRDGALEREVRLPELAVGRISGLVVAFCRALARREATPSEKDGTVVCPESRGGTGCTPMMTKGTIRGSEDDDVRDVSALEGRSEESDVVEGVSTDMVVLAVDGRRDGMGVGGRSSTGVFIPSKSLSASNVGDGAAVVAAVVVVVVEVDDDDECSALNRYIKRYVKEDPEESSAAEVPEAGSESFRRACANCVLPCRNALKNPPKLPSGALVKSSSVASAKSVLKSCKCVAVLSVDSTSEAARAAPATYKNRDNISA